MRCLSNLFSISHKLPSRKLRHLKVSPAAHKTHKLAHFGFTVKPTRITDFYLKRFSSKFISEFIFLFRSVIFFRFLRFAGFFPLALSQFIHCLCGFRDKSSFPICLCVTWFVYISTKFNGSKCVCFWERKQWNRISSWKWLCKSRQTALWFRRLQKKNVRIQNDRFFFREIRSATIERS